MKLWIIAIPLCAVLLCVFSIWSIRTTSVTLDETVYLGGALQTIHDHRLDPRLAAQGVAPLPILMEYLPALFTVVPQERTSLWVGGLEDASLITGPRYLTMLLVGVPLVGVVFFWLYKRRGLSAAITGAILAALSPTILAHSAVATTDMAFALFALLALAAIAGYFKKPSLRRFLLMALGIASAMSAKYTGLLLLPVVLFLLLTQTPGATESNRLLRACLQFGGLLLLIFLLWWGFHFFALVEHPESGIRIPAPIAGVEFQALHNREGHTAFLCGKSSQTGWWYYYAYAFFFKSTPVELAIAVMLITLFAMVLRAPLQSFRSLDAEKRTLLITVLSYVVVLSFSRINIGHRYLLPLYPVLIILGIDSLWIRLGNSKGLRFAAAVLLMCGQMWSCLSVAPHYLSYFNSLVGGPSQGWRLLSDSNVDWGQDLPALGQELQKHPNAQTALSYFGTALPQAYGIQADSIEKRTRPSGEYDLLAVSATHLQGQYGTGDQPFRKFLTLTPASRAGYSIFLYDLKDPSARSAFEFAVSLIDRSSSTAEPLSLYAFTMTLMASQDFPNADIFDLCYANLLRNLAASPAQLEFVETRLRSAPEAVDYKTRFRLAILHLARWTLLPRVAESHDGEQWVRSFDFELFRKDYADSRALLKGAGEIGKPLMEGLERTAGRIDANHDGILSDSEITTFLSSK